MDKPRIFLGSSGKQERLLKSLTSGLATHAEVLAWTDAFPLGVSTLDRLVELTREVDLAAFVFAQDDWTGDGIGATPGQASPRDNVVFEAGLFGGVLGMPRTFILHAKGAKLPSDLLGLTCLQYDHAEVLSPHELKVINQKVRKAITDAWTGSRIEGDWWQYSLTARSEGEPSAVSLLRIARDRTGGLEVSGRAWQEDGTLSARYWSEATKQRTDPAGVFYFWKGERPRHPDAPQLEGTGEIRLESEGRASGYWTTRSERVPEFHARTSGVYLRADPGDMALLDGADNQRRAELIAARLQDWASIANS